MAVVVVLPLWPMTGLAQQGDQDGQAGQTTAIGAPGQEEQAPNQGQTPKAAPDPRSFSGAAGFSAQAPGGIRSYFQPSFQFSEMGDSNFSFTPGPQKFETVDSFIGRLDYLKAGRHSQTTAEYLGGGTIYNHHSNYNTTEQQLGINQTYRGRRWSFMLDERATYMPESPFGSGAFGWTGALGPGVGGAFGSNLGTLNPALTPNESLLTSRGSCIMNSATTEIQYLAGPRSSITLGGSFGLLHFRTPGSIDSRNGNAFIGFSHTLSARDFLGFNYGFSLFKFQHIGTSFTTHQFQLSYGHRINGRMAIDVGGGPEINSIKDPVSGSSTPITLTAHGSLDFRSRRRYAALSYNRSTTNGGGLLLGATTDNIQMAWTTLLSRQWSASIAPGYSHNRSIPQTGGHAQTTINSDYFGVNLSRMFGRYTSMFFSYNFQTQNSQATPCLAGNCRSSFLRHVVGFGFDFHPRQISVD